MKRFSLLFPILVLSFLLTACGKDTDVIKDVASSSLTVSENNTENQAAQYDDLASLDISDAPDIEKITREEFKNLSTLEIKKIIKKYVTDYKKTYNIHPDYVMTDEDWDNLRPIMEYQLFGTEKKTQRQLQEEMVKADLSEDEIYYMFPDPDEIEKMSAGQFAQYFNEACEYFIDNNTPRIDMTKLSEQEILKAKEEYIAIIRKDKETE